MSKILNYGSLNIDYVYNVPHFVMPGETLAAINRNVFAGGKGLNQSVALSRAGGEVYHAGAVGKDDSQVLTDAIAANNIDDKFLMRRNGPADTLSFKSTPQDKIVFFFTAVLTKL